MRVVAGMDQDSFYDWAQKFVEETGYLRRNETYILLVYDGFAGHLKYAVLNLFKRNRIIVAGLPAHTSHALQPLDVGVFSALKNSFKNLISKRTITSKKGTRNDIFKIC